MDELRKRLVMLFVGLVPTIIAFWLTLWFWVDMKPEFTHDVYITGWIIMIFLLVGVPCIIFAVMTGTLAFTEDRRLNQEYDRVMCMVRGTRAILSRRIAPPVEEDSEAG